MCGLEFPTNSHVLVGLERADDAGVYQLSDDVALIQTVDFFTPIVDDPYDFGRIAAANALSDVYAMGGVPKTAMNLVGFPLKQMDISVLRDIIRGGIDTLKAADVVLVGGHSIEDTELKYGLSVTGWTHPDRILTKHGLKEGDALVLTKPLGTGIVNTAIKAGMASPTLIEMTTRLMAALNKTAAEIMADFPVHACTDITGFGFLGHLAEMLSGTGLAAEILHASLPIIPEAKEFGAMGLIPAGAYRNREFREAMIRFSPDTPQVIQDILFDPQTSGGLLIALDAAYADALLSRLRQNDVDNAAIVGYIHTDQHSHIRVM